MQKMFVARFLVAHLLVALVLTVVPDPATADQTVPGSQRGASSLADVINHPAYTETDAATLRLYRAFFDREPDLAGAVYWLAQSRNGACIDDLIWAFANSNEFQAVYGSNLSDSQFLTIVYSHVAGRTPDPSGFDYWMGQMNEGLSRHDVVRWIVANPELIGRYPYAPAVWSGNVATYAQCYPTRAPSITPRLGPIDRDPYLGRPGAV